MKKLLIALITLLLCTPLSAQEFKNLSFEAVSDSIPGQPAEWSANKGIKFSQVANAARDGNFAAAIEGTFENEEYGYVFQEQPIQLAGLKKFKISAEVKTEYLEDANFAVYGFVKKGEQYLNFKATDLVEEALNNWESKSLTIWVDENATNIQLGVRFTGKAKFYIDEFKIEEVEVEEKPLSWEAALYVDEFLNIIAAHSLYKSSIDISKLRKIIERVASGAQTIEEVYPALPVALKQVDKHSMFWTKKTIDEWRAPKGDQKGDGKDLPDIRVTTGKLIDEDIAYLNMPSIGSGNVDELIYFADTLQQLIRKLDRPGLKGWVLDLRQNDGGNCWPMLAGIGPVLGEGECGYFALGDEYTAWSYVAGASKMGGSDQTKVSGAPYELLQPNPRVAVLLGGKTASSGEVTAVAFQARPNSRSFGQPTAAYTTTNSNFEMSDGSMLLLAVSVYADRSKRKYGQEITPDVLVESTKNNDEPLEKAVEWLRKN